MSLLPALFQNTDPMPMALGAKIVAPVPKKPDPFKAFEAFEKRDYTPNVLGRLPVIAHHPGDYTEPWRMPTLAERRAAVGMPPIEVKVPVGETVEFFNPEHRSTAARTHADVREAQNAVRAAVVGGVSQERLRNMLEVFGAPRVSALADRDLGHFTREVSALAGASQAMDELRLQYRDQMPTLREEAIAAKMAEVQRQKQQLRALVRKDAKR